MPKYVKFGTNIIDREKIKHISSVYNEDDKEYEISIKIDGDLSYFDSVPEKNIDNYLKKLVYLLNK